MTLQTHDAASVHAQCKKLGAALLDAMAYTAPYLRAKDAFWESLPAADAYICPTEGTATG